MSSTEFVNEHRTERHPATGGRTAVRTGSARPPVRGRTQRYAATAAVVGGPAVLLGGIIYHPFIADLRDKDAVAAALEADHHGWMAAHVVAAVGGGLVILAQLAVRSALRERGEQRWSALSVPFAVLGGTAFGMLPAMELAVLAAAEAGSDTAAVLRAMNPSFVPVLQIGALLFAVAMIALAVAVVRSQVLSRWTTALFVVAAVVAATSRFLPLGAALTVGAVALLVALWTLAPAVSRPAPRD